MEQDIKILRLYSPIPQKRGIQLQILEEETHIGDPIPLEDFLSLATNLKLIIRTYGGTTYCHRIYSKYTTKENNIGFYLYESFDSEGLNPRNFIENLYLRPEATNMLLDSNYITNSFTHSR